jgi:hypothetical protein
MRIVEIDIRHFRGIEHCLWHLSPQMNCLIGPGDSTKTTILDAVELALKPRQNFLMEDSDFFNCDITKPIEVTVTVVGFPAEFIQEDRYGLYLRGWEETAKRVLDEPAAGLAEALSIRFAVDQDLEARWSLFNDRIAASEDDPPALRFKDAQMASTVRLGPYADHHLSWGRQSALSRIGVAKEKVSDQLAQAMRAARDAFKKHDKPPFALAAGLVEELSKKFSVGVRSKYLAALDFGSLSVTNGGISLHDGDLPLRRLGTGSARLLVSAIQHSNGVDSPFALIDEIETGLEPHRLARLIKFLKEPTEAGRAVQCFCTTHSLVAIREMAASDIFCVRSNAGTTSVLSAEATAKSTEIAQRHIRQSPDAFLARRVIVCEGATEHGFLRALDEIRSPLKPSFALQGVIAVDGRGNPQAADIADHLATLGHGVLLFLDGDKKLDVNAAGALKSKSVQIFEWQNDAATEDRIFLDLSWDGVKAVISLVLGWYTEESIRDSINARCDRLGISRLADLTLPSALDTIPLRNAFAVTAKEKDWFKQVSKGELLGHTIQPHFKAAKNSLLVEGLKTIFGWSDA